MLFLFSPYCCVFFFHLVLFFLLMFFFVFVFLLSLPCCYCTLLLSCLIVLAPCSHAFLTFAHGLFLCHVPIVSCLLSHLATLLSLPYHRTLLPCCPTITCCYSTITHHYPTIVPCYSTLLVNGPWCLAIAPSCLAIVPCCLPFSSTSWPLPPIVVLLPYCSLLCLPIMHRQFILPQRSLMQVEELGTTLTSFIQQ